MSLIESNVTDFVCFETDCFCPDVCLVAEVTGQATTQSSSLQIVDTHLLIDRKARPSQLHVDLDFCNSHFSFLSRNRILDPSLLIPRTSWPILFASRGISSSAAGSSAQTSNIWPVESLSSSSLTFRTGIGQYNPIQSNVRSALWSNFSHSCGANGDLFSTNESVICISYSKKRLVKRAIFKV